MSDRCEPRIARTGPGLADLAAVPLGPRLDEMLCRARRTCGGGNAWTLRKLREAADLCAMAELAPRLELLHLDLDVNLMAVLRLRVPTSCRGDDESVTSAPHAILALRYPEEVLRRPQPGAGFIRILEPTTAFHPNISPKPPHVLCLGSTLPAGIPCRELVLMTYAALAFQTTMLDPREGVMNLEASRYFAQNQGRLPLTREPFLTSS